jgi:hypothetical protein
MFRKVSVEIILGAISASLVAAGQRGGGGRGGTPTTTIKKGTPKDHSCLRPELRTA